MAPRSCCSCSRSAVMRKPLRTKNNSRLVKAPVNPSTLQWKRKINTIAIPRNPVSAGCTPSTCGMEVRREGVQKDSGIIYKLLWLRSSENIFWKKIFYITYSCTFTPSYRYLAKIYLWYCDTSIPHFLSFSNIKNVFILSPISSTSCTLRATIRTAPNREPHGPLKYPRQLS